MRRGIILWLLGVPIPLVCQRRQQWQSSTSTFGMANKLRKTARTPSFPDLSCAERTGNNICSRVLAENIKSGSKTPVEALIITRKWAGAYDHFCN